MRIILLTILLTILTLTTSAEEITTSNLVTNGNFETGNANNWTTSGDVQVLNDCCELNGVSSNYDLEFGDSGSIQQDFNLSSNTITQNMLDNGITLNSSIDAQNGECGVAGCWGGQGSADTFTNVLTIKDSDGNTLASNTTIRTDVTGIDGAIFTDRLIYNGTGSNVGNIHLSGSDGNAPGYLGGPNLDNISVTMTYNDEVISNEIVQEIGNIFEELREEIFEEFTFEEIEEVFEEMVMFFKEPPLLEEMMPEEELSFEPMLMVVEEMPMEEEIIMEEEAVMEKEIIQAKPMFSLLPPPPAEEEIYEESQEIIASFLPMLPSEEETIMEEEMIEKEMVEEMPVEEEIVQEKPSRFTAAPKEEEKEEVIEEETMEEEPKQMAQKPNEEKETIKEEKPTSETSKKSAVPTKKITKQKKVQSKGNKTTNVKSQSRLVNLEKVMDKVDKDIKDISKNLQIKNIIKIGAMTNDQASLDIYNVPFYKSEDIYLDQLQIQDLRQVYADTTLSNYITNDPVFIMQDKLNKINIEKQRILIELEQLKNG
jgi:hypothetical protein